MLTVIQTLNEATFPEHITERECEVMRELGPYLEQIRQTISDEFLDGLQAAYYRLTTNDADTSFERGFRLGARLMMEVMGAESDH